MMLDVNRSLAMAGHEFRSGKSRKWSSKKLIETLEAGSRVTVDGAAMSSTPSRRLGDKAEVRTPAKWRDRFTLMLFQYDRYNSHLSAWSSTRWGATAFFHPDARMLSSRTGQGTCLGSCSSGSLKIPNRVTSPLQSTRLPPPGPSPPRTLPVRKRHSHRSRSRCTYERGPERSVLIVTPLYDGNMRNPATMG